ncbi:MAG TPA: hypothetical protein VKR60_10955 [Candidatus Sulfotelmatobacter sp.]|nr:hypothetical protein [Candidatus Sulfotelmatobacter sp.]
MRIFSLSCLLLLVATFSSAQDTNFSDGPQYLLTGSPLLARPLATPSMSLDAALPPIPASSISASEPATGVGFAPNPELEHRADLLPVYYGVPNYYQAASASVVELSFSEGTETSSASLPVSIVESGVTEFVDAQALRIRGHGITLAEAAAYARTHKLTARHTYTNEDLKRLHAAG